MFRHTTIVLAMSLVLTACGSGIEGTYVAQEDGFLDQINFIDDERVELTFMGSIREGTWEIREDSVRINNNGDISVLRITDTGCLQGDGILGSYCKGKGGASQSNTVTSRSDQGDSDLIGSRFAGGPAGDEWTFEFLDESTVHMMIDGDGENLAYVAKGNEVIIKGVDGEELVLAKRGRDLEGGPQGMIMVFKKRS